VGNLDDDTIELELADCQLRSLAQEAADSIVGLAQAKDISIKVDCSDLTVNIDERRMMQVLINLLSNAIKFSSADSTVCIGGRKVKGGVQIFVEDEGTGMDAETASKIFEKYVSGVGQTEKAFGLGLAICQLIVTAHGGTLSVDSQPGRGSTFFISLPSP
jgi:signal transduction histidine kinase